jgi:hypothetical protein
MSLSLFGCPDETSTTGAGGSGGNGSDGGAGGGATEDGGGGQVGTGGASADLAAAAQTNCDVQCACSTCDQAQMDECLDVTTGHNAPDKAECNDEYVVYLDCMSDNWDCDLDPLGIIVTYCQSQYEAVDTCDDAP